MSTDRDARAALPQVDVVLHAPVLADRIDRSGRAAVAAAVRTELAHRRAALAAERRAAGGGTNGSPANGDRADGGRVDADALAEEVARAAAARLDADEATDLTRVVNATGVVLHTNLGRAPLSEAARAAVAAAAGYSDLELDLATGQRGSRTRNVGRLAARASGTEAATVVNNGAGALVLLLAALAHGREVIVSRGELIEIGGSYRLPDVMAAAGVRLVEVGTTNRTRRADYARAVTEDTGLLLKVHHANFAMIGFTEQAPLAELVTLGRERGVPVIHDLGSGLLRDADPAGPLAGEPSVEASVAAGADLIVFSGDKLLGGPQAGIIAGRADLVEACRRHPLARALRIDGLQRAALEATLRAHLRAPVPTDLPALAMLHVEPDVLRERAQRIVTALAAEIDGIEAVPTASRTGGGTLPTSTLDSWALALPGPASAITRALRAGTPPVIGRTVDGRVLLDLRTVEFDDELASLLRDAFARLATPDRTGVSRDEATDGPRRR